MEEQKDLDARIEKLKRDLYKTELGESYAPPFKYPSNGCMSLAQDEFPDTETRQRAESELRSIIDNNPQYATKAKKALREGLRFQQNMDTYHQIESPGPGCLAILVVSAATVATAGYGIYKLVQYFME